MRIRLPITIFFFLQRKINKTGDGLKNAGGTIKIIESFIQKYTMTMITDVLRNRNSKK